MSEKNEFGISHEAMSWIIRVFRVFPEIEEVLIFGSRAKGTHSDGSDIDLAVKGHFPSYNYPERIKNMLQEGLYLPYFFDVADYYKITNEKLKEHIDRVGKTIFVNTNPTTTQ